MEEKVEIILEKYIKPGKILVSKNKANENYLP